MINLLIYLDTTEQAERLVHDLLREKLVASASIDSHNQFYTVEDGMVQKKIHCVLTCQTKANLFSKISRFISEKHQIDPPIFSLPITQSNDLFAAAVRSKTEERVPKPQ